MKHAISLVARSSVASMIVIASMVSVATAQIRQDKIYIDDGTGLFTVIKSYAVTSGSNTIWLPKADGMAVALINPNSITQAFNIGDVLYAASSGNVLTRLARTSDGQVLTLSSGTPAWANNLTNFTESANSSAPNATVTVVQLLATNAATDVDVAITPKGAGALLAQIPDNTTVGGNKRGSNAVDWQSIRTVNTQVAEGNSATIGGGQGNTAGGDYSTVAGGGGNTASFTSAAVGGGALNTASQSGSTVAGGTSNTASASYSVVAGGYANSATANYSCVPGGTQALASNFGQLAQASGKFSTQGDAQSSVFVLRRQTTDATTSSLFLDGSGTRIAVPASGAMTFHVLVVGKESGGGGTVGSWEITGGVKNNAGTASIVGVTNLTTNNQPGTWGVAPDVVANGANMDVVVTGKAATTIDWVARVETAEVVF